MRGSCVGGHGLSVAPRHPGIARIDAIRARCAVIALDGHVSARAPAALAIMSASDAAPVISDRAKIERSIVLAMASSPSFCETASPRLGQLTASDLTTFT